MRKSTKTLRQKCENCDKIVNSYQYCQKNCVLSLNFCFLCIYGILANLANSMGWRQWQWQDMQRHGIWGLWHKCTTKVFACLCLCIICIIICIMQRHKIWRLWHAYKLPVCLCLCLCVSLSLLLSSPTMMLAGCIIYVLLNVLYWDTGSDDCGTTLFAYKLHKCHTPTVENCINAQQNGNSRLKMPQIWGNRYRHNLHPFQKCSNGAIPFWIN